MLTTAMGALNGASYLNSAFDTGWLPAEEEDSTSTTLKKLETWTKSGLLAITITGDRTSRYKPGMKIRLDQDAVTKYFTVLSVSYLNPYTNLTLDGYGIYTLSDSTLSNCYYSVLENPIGWPEAWNYIADVGGWTSGLTATYVSATSIQIATDVRDRIQKGTKITFRQSQAFTNDPAAGANIVLNMADTSGFVVGNTVIVSSSAGSEQTTVTAISANVSITVANLTLDHTLVNPLVTCIKYASIIGVSYAAPNTTLTLAYGSDFSLINTTITDFKYSNIENPIGWPHWFNYSPTYSASESMTFTSVTTTFAKFRIITNECEIQIKATGTTGGTASTEINASLPVAPLQTDSRYRSGDVTVSDPNLAAGGSHISTTWNFRKYDASIFGLGANRTVAGRIRYPI